MVFLLRLVYSQNEDPSSCDISAILSFLQELLDKGCTSSMLKVYMPAITVNHALGAGQSVGRNNFVIKFLREARRLNLPHPHTVPVWDLSMDSISKNHPADSFSVGQTCGWHTGALGERFLFGVWV